MLAGQLLLVFWLRVSFFDIRLFVRKWTLLAV